MVILPSIRRKYMANRIPKGATVQMSECVVVLRDKKTHRPTDRVPYTGSAQTLEVFVTWQGDELAVNEQYTVAFANNVNIGPATVTVTGMGQFAGSVTKTFYVTNSALVPWNSIDLDNIVDTNESAALSGVTELYHMQVLAYGRLFFVDAYSHKMYIWAFDDDHPFEVSHFKSSAASVSDGSFDAQIGALSPSGLQVAYTKSSFGYFRTRPLSMAFNLTSIGGAGTEVVQQFTSNPRIHITRDGFKLVVKGKGGNEFHMYEAATKNDFSASLTHVSSYNFSNYISGTFRDFAISEDGLTILVVVDGSVRRIDLSAPFDMTSGTLHESSFTPTGFTGNIEGIAVSNDATKILLFDGGEGKFHEYDISDEEG